MDGIVLLSDIITKLPESGDLCGNITEFGWWKNHLSSKRSDIAI